MPARLFEPLTDRPARRTGQLAVGLFGYGASLALMVRARLGLDPWDVFHQGLGRVVHHSIGTVIIVVSLVVLLAWIPLRQRPGVGTLANAVLVGVATNAVLAVLPSPHAMAARIGLLIAGVFGNATATGLYIGAGLGPGPRDGLMTGLAARGISIRVARTCVEASVLAAGFFLGGTIGVGTVLYAASIGPLVHIVLPRLALAPRRSPA